MSPDNQNLQPTPIQPQPATPATPPATTTAAPMQEAAPTAPVPAQPASPAQTTQAGTAQAQAASATAASPTAPQAQATQPAPPVVSCKCPAINPADWDKKKTTLSKTFYKAYSPRIFYYPFSFVIDLYRAQKAAVKKGYKPVENGMIIDDGAMFLGHVMVEVTGANINDPNVLSLEGKEIYTKVSRNEWKNIRFDIADLAKELGKKPAQLFIWWTSCPKCTSQKEAKAILIALP